MVLLFAGILIKAFKDSIGRLLLLTAAKGWGITEQVIQNRKWLIYLSCFLYFVFDVLYEINLRTNHNIQLWVLMLTSFPLIILNTLIFYLTFSWFAKTFYQLNFLKQNYKLGLMKQFASLLGCAGLVSVLWGALEVLARFFLAKELVWKWMWLYFGIWDIIFLMIVISLMMIWRISEKSKLLAVSQELRNDDNELSHEEEAKYGIELAKV